MYKNSFLLPALVVSLLVAWMLSASILMAEEVSSQTMRSLQKRYASLQSLEFDFTQITHVNGRLKEGKGHAVFCRPSGKKVEGTAAAPGVIRWHYQQPVEQIIINDGKEIAMYTPEDKQLLITAAGAMETDITSALFAGTRSLLDTFDVAPEDTSFQLSTPRSAGKAFLLTPKEPQAQLKRTQIWVNDDLTITQVLMEDHFGSLTELAFTGLAFNTLKGSNKDLQTLTNLELAPGTETIRQ